MPIIFVAMFLCSCSPRQHDMHSFSQKSDMNQTDVHKMSAYSDMSAAHDAGATPSSSNERPESGGVK